MFSYPHNNQTINTRLDIDVVREKDWFLGPYSSWLKIH